MRQILFLFDIFVYSASAIMVILWKMTIKKSSPMLNQSFLCNIRKTCFSYIHSKENFTWLSGLFTGVEPLFMGCCTTGTKSNVQTTGESFTVVTHPYTHRSDQLDSAATQTFPYWILMEILSTYQRPLLLVGLIFLWTLRGGGEWPLWNQCLIKDEIHF